MIEKNYTIRQTDCFNFQTIFAKTLSFAGFSCIMELRMCFVWEWDGYGARYG